MNNPVFDSRSKIRSHHLELMAYIYIRQSSPYQVENNLESKRRQYNLVDWAQQMGWSKDKVVLVDEDQAAALRLKCEPAPPQGNGPLVGECRP